MTEGLGDKMKGRAKETAGQVEESTGRAIGDTDMEARGDAKQMEGKADRAKGNVEGAIGHAKRNVENAIDDATS
jgi:uncharacterized protein YjbJ (UPF0337 family)